VDWPAVVVAVLTVRVAVWGVWPTVPVLLVVVGCVVCGAVVVAVLTVPVAVWGVWPTVPVLLVVAGCVVCGAVVVVGFTVLVAGWLVCPAVAVAVVRLPVAVVSDATAVSPAPETADPRTFAASAGVPNHSVSRITPTATREIRLAHDSAYLSRCNPETCDKSRQIWPRPNTPNSLVPTSVTGKTEFSDIFFTAVVSGDRPSPHDVKIR
jgi:hypothetical protein